MNPTPNAASRTKTTKNVLTYWPATVAVQLVEHLNKDSKLKGLNPTAMCWHQEKVEKNFIQDGHLVEELTHNPKFWRNPGESDKICSFD